MSAIVAGFGAIILKVVQLIQIWCNSNCSGAINKETTHFICQTNRSTGIILPTLVKIKANIRNGEAYE
jgi:hypothetical protein